MKVYVLVAKNQGSYSHDIRIVLAKDKRELKKILKDGHININEYVVDVKTKSGIVHEDIY